MREAAARAEEIAKLDLRVRRAEGRALETQKLAREVRADTAEVKRMALAMKAIADRSAIIVVRRPAVAALMAGICGAAVSLGLQGNVAQMIVAVA